MRKIAPLLGMFFLAVGLVSGTQAYENNLEAEIVYNEREELGPRKADAPSLVLHYYRFDNDYTGMNAWVWNYLGDGERSNDPDNEEEVFFTTPDTSWGGQYGTFPMRAGYIGYVGVIVKRGAGWGTEGDNVEPESLSDRFVKISEVEKGSDGNYHIYLCQGQTQIGRGQKELAGNCPERRPLYSAELSIDRKSFEIKPNLDTTPTSYKLYRSDDTVNPYKQGPFSSLRQSGEFYYIDFDNYVDLSHSYSIHYTYSNTLTGASGTHKRTISYRQLYNSQVFDRTYQYSGELGAIYDKTNKSTTFRLWAPECNQVDLLIYSKGTSVEQSAPDKTVTMSRKDKGVYEHLETSDVAFKYYTFKVYRSEDIFEVVDPYAYSTGANGDRGMIVDFSQTNPNDWKYNDRPRTVTNWTDYIVYELHVRDLTSHSSWGGRDDYQGKFMGFTEKDTRFSDGTTSVKTGLDHLSELGINAVQLLPIYDNGMIDETRLDDPNQNLFNWGYMPKNFNTLEGSYATDPYDGKVRINEFKQLVNALHGEDIRIIMDVVYNHTGENYRSNFHQILPGYYHRMADNNTFLDASACSNETASERSMMRKFMIDSVKFWATEYNLSGFRFDLMGIHDVTTMNMIVDELQAIDPTIIVYGEPWAASAPGVSNPADKSNAQICKAGMFNDTTRDAIKGSTFEQAGPGWVQPQPNEQYEDGTPNTTKQENNHYAVRFGITGGSNANKFIDERNYGFANDPNRIINYVSAHDNNTLRDKLYLSMGGEHSNEIDVKLAQIQANAIVLTSQGVPFLHAGVDFMRSKPNSDGSLNHNSYEASDQVNQIRWGEKIKHKDVFDAYQELIGIRKEYEHFRMSSMEEIINSINFHYNPYSKDQITYSIVKNGVTVYVTHDAQSGQAVNMGQSLNLLNPKSSFASSGANVSSFTPLTRLSYIYASSSHKVTYNYMDEMLENQTMHYGLSETLEDYLPENEKGHYYISGWYTDANYANPYDPSKPLDGDITLYAKWEAKTYKVRYTIDGKTTTIEVKYGNKINLSDPFVPGYEFKGWYQDRKFEVPFDKNALIEKDMEIFPLLEKIEVNYDEKVTVTINLNGTEYEYSVVKGTKITEEGLVTGEGWEIEGWYTDQEYTNAYNFDEPLTGDIVLYAKVISAPKGLGGGAIAGIIIGSILGVAGITVGVFFLVRFVLKKKKAS